MAWENLEEDIAEEFSDCRRLGRAETGFLFFRRSHRGPREAQPLSNKERLRLRRLERRARLIASGRIPTRCERQGCCNLLQMMKRGAPQHFCSEECKKWRPGKPVNSGLCPHCARPFTPKPGNPTYCSHACRTRAWKARLGYGA